MIRIYLFIAGFLPFVLQAQETKEVVVKNADARYVERFSVLKSDTTIKHGTYRRMDFFGGAPQLLGSYKMGKKNGRWQEFSIWDVFLAALGNYTDDKRTGLWTFYSKLNVKEQEYDYTQKKLVYFAKDVNVRYTVIKGKDTAKKVMLERPPLFIGGTVSLQSFIFTHLIYPQSAFKKGSHGSVQVSCVIGADGHIGKIWVSKGIEKSLNAAALTTMKQLPDTWLPALERGKPVASIFVHEIPFILQE
jgi:TonB family protein